MCFGSPANEEEEKESKKGVKESKKGVKGGADFKSGSG
jgi:hypothetical protein